MIINTGRPATLARQGMVTCPHSLASAAGIDVLRAGGSAIDAAIAASAMLSVVYPHMTSIGGDAFWLIWDAKLKRARFLDGGGRACAAATHGWLAERGFDAIPYRGIIPATLTTPGAVASWGAAHKAYGRLKLSRVLESAIEAARDGVPVTARVAGWISDTARELATSEEAARIFLPAGRPLAAGSHLINRNLARTLTAIAEGGTAGFYEGEVARELVRYSRRHGGLWTAADLVAQDARWGEPLAGSYRDAVIYNTPPPTQGMTVIEMLNLLEPLELGQRPLGGPDHLHFLVQAKQIAYADRDRHLADPRFAEVPVSRLISKPYADERRRLMRPKKAIPWDQVPPSKGSLKGDTVYVAAVDREGNAASLIQSLYWGFGSGLVGGRTGVVLQNRAAYFSLDPAHPNCLEPGKTPLHTLIAALATRNDKLWAVLGCMGADGQPQIQVQTLVALLDYGLDIQAALELPRFLSGRFVLGEARDVLHLEGRIDQSTFKELARRGHAVERWPDWAELAGHAHGIVVDQVSGTLMGGSDPRSDGAAVGY